MAKKSTFEEAYKEIVKITAKNFKANKSKKGGKRDRLTFRSISEFDIAVLDLSQGALLAEGLSPFQARLILEFLSNNKDHPDVRALLSSNKEGGTSKAGFKTVSSRVSKVVKLINQENPGEDLNIHTAHQRGASASLAGKIQTFSNLGTGMFTTRAGNTTAGTKRKFTNQTKAQSNIRRINNEFLISNKDAIAREVRAKMEKAIYQIEGQGIVVEDFVKEIIESNAKGRPLQTVTFGTADFNTALGRKVEKPLNTALNKVLTEYASKLEENLAKKLGKDVEDLRASPSIEEKVALGLVNVLADKKVKLAKKSKKKIGNKAKKRAVKVTTNNKAVVGFKKVSMQKKKGQVQAQMSPLALRGLLQRAISEAVQRNMGKGRARKVLNYRTGRFAESVNIDNVVPRRDGAMIAFYSYMKNPYSTFAEGGAQYRNEPARDPNLLIKKSLRQIAIGALAIPRFFPMES